METPAPIPRHRTFLAPLWLTALIALIVLAALGVAVAAYVSATTTTVIIERHAGRVLGTIADPPLTPEGERRAQRLARMFGDLRGPGRLAAIYVSDTRRARQTAVPLASRLGIRPVVLSSTDARTVAARILREHHGQAVLVLGAGDDVPQLVYRLSGIRIAPIGADEYDRLYILSIPRVGDAGLVQLAY